MYDWWYGNEMEMEKEDEGNGKEEGKEKFSLWKGVGVLEKIRKVMGCRDKGN